MEKVDAKRIRSVGANGAVPLVVLDPVQVEGRTQQILRLDDRGACPALRGDGRCGVHERQGEAALATACAVFPRTSLMVRGGNRDAIEVTGSLACPQLARLTLLSPDGLTQSPSPRPVLSRDYVGKVVDLAGDDAYLSSFMGVRRVLLALFGHSKFPFASRLAFAANLAAQVDDFYYQGTTAFEGAGALFARQRLDAELAAAGDPRLQRRLHEDMETLGYGGGPGVLVTLTSMLTERLRLPHSARFADLVADSLQSLRDEARDQMDVTGEVGPIAIFSMYRRRKVLVAGRVPGVLDNLLARYASHYLLRHPYTDAPSLLVYLGRLGLATAAVGLLVLGSPEIKDRLDAACDVQLDGDALARTTVQVVQTLTKTITHHVSFLDAIHGANESNGLSFGTLVLFAKFL
jgi:lysine-N-methylase